MNIKNVLKSKAIEHTKGAILCSARSLIAKKGFENFSIRTLASEVGFTPPTIYSYFKSKDAILKDLCEEDFKALLEHYQLYSAKKEGIARVRAILWAYLDFAHKNPTEFRLMFITPVASQMDASVDLQKGDPSEDAYSFYLEAIADAFKKNKIKAKPDKIVAVAQLFWTGVHGIATLSRFINREPWFDPLNEQILFDEMVDALFVKVFGKAK